MSQNGQNILDRYLAVWTDPSPQRDLSLLDDLTSDQVRFKDPIQEVRGREKLKAIFTESSRTVTNSNVVIDAIAWAGEERAFVKWRYAGTIERINLRNWSVTGMSDIRLDQSGRVHSHEDYWDLAGGLFEHFPVIGWLFRRLRHRLRLEH
jgi:steroid delta-isomerase